MNLYSVFMVNSTSGWAVGGSSATGVILNYNAGTWSVWKNVSYQGYANATDTINATLCSVTADSTGATAWITGASGTTLCWCGGYWFGVPNVTQNTLRSVKLGSDSVYPWVVGDNGIILHYNGHGWTTVTSPTKANLNTLQIINSTYGWAAGGSNNNGVVLMYNGVAWSNWTLFNFASNGSTTSVLPATINSMRFENATSAWAVGSSGAVMYWNGTTWSCFSNVVNGNLNSVSVVHGVTGVNQAWAVGDNGIIIAFNGTNWVPEFPILVIPLLMSIGLVAAVFGKRLYKKTL